MTSEKKTHVTEIVAGIIAVLGLAAGTGAWWMGAHIMESAGITIGFLCPSAMFALVGEGLRTGKMGSQGHKVFRDKEPLKFWGVAIFYGFIGCALFLTILTALVLRV